MSTITLEQGVLITPCSERTNQYVTLLLQVCRKYNIDYSNATDLERKFVQDSVEIMLTNKKAV